LGDGDYQIIITEIGAEHFIGGHHPISYCNVLLVGLFSGRVGIKARTQRLDRIGVNTIELEEEIGAKMGFRGI
jgi:hypothetical protein